MSRSTARFFRSLLRRHRRCFLTKLNADVIDIILMYVDTYGLQALCLVSQFTYPCAARALYRSVHVTSGNIESLLRTLIEEPSYRNLVRHVVVDVSEPYVWAPMLSLCADIEQISPTLVGSIKGNHRTQIGLLVSRLPAMLSFEIQYSSCHFARVRSFCCDGRSARCDSRPIREILSYGFDSLSFNNVQRVSIQHCSLSQVHHILGLPSLQSVQLSITEGAVSELSLPQSRSRVGSLDINIREYLSSAIPLVLQSCEALRKVRLVVTGCPQAADLNSQTFFEALRFHQSSLQEIFYHSLHEDFKPFDQANVFAALLRCSNLTRLSTSILPFANVFDKNIWSRVPPSLHHITLFDSKGYSPLLIAPQGPLEMLATDHSVLPGLRDIELTTFFYGWDHEPWENQNENKRTVSQALRSRGIELAHTDWLDRFL